MIDVTPMDYSAALCRGRDPEPFFEQSRTPEMLALCDTCPVQPACIREHVNERMGVWGCSERARRRLRPLLRARPDMSDVELMQIARRDSQGRPVARVIAMTAMAESDAERAVRLLRSEGFDDRQIADMLGGSPLRMREGRA